MLYTCIPRTQLARDISPQAYKESILGMSSGPHRSLVDHSTVSLNLRTIAHDITFVEGGTIGKFHIL